MATSAVLLWTITGGVYVLNLTKLAWFPLKLIEFLYEHVGRDRVARVRTTQIIDYRREYDALTSSLIIGVF